MWLMSLCIDFSWKLRVVGTEPKQIRKCTRQFECDSKLSLSVSVCFGYAKKEKEKKEENRFPLRRHAVKFYSIRRHTSTTWENGMFCHQCAISNHCDSPLSVGLERARSGGGGGIFPSIKSKSEFIIILSSWTEYALPPPPLNIVCMCVRSFVFFILRMNNAYFYIQLLDVKICGNKNAQTHAQWNVSVFALRALGFHNTRNENVRAKMPFYFLKFNNMVSVGMSIYHLNACGKSSHTHTHTRLPPSPRARTHIIH